MKKITEDTNVPFKAYEELSYTDNGGQDVVININNVPLGKAKVWLDSEMDEREYVCINYEIIYLDTLTKI